LFVEEKGIVKFAAALKKHRDLRRLAIPGSVVSETCMRGIRIARTMAYLPE
jgi:hypothetical protein